MAIEYINVGALPNDQLGDPMRVAFQKINNNFSYVEQTSTNIASAVTLTNVANQVIFQYPADEFTQGQFQIKTYTDTNNDSQDVILAAQIYNDESNVKFTAYGTTFVGNAVTRYDMDVSGGNVRILVSPIQNVALNHFISYQITYTGDLGVGVLMTTESGSGLLTETGGGGITTEG